MNDWIGTRVRLRALEPSDVDAFYTWNQDTGNQRKLAHVWLPSSRAALKQWLEKQSAKRTEGDEFMLVIENLEGEFVGVISTHHCEPRVGCFQYGIGIMPAHQRRGYAHEAMRLVLRFMFLERRYQKVTAEIFSYNEPSQKMHEAFGFQFEGRIRRTLYTNGEYHDQLFYGMTREEFEERYNA